MTPTTDIRKRHLFPTLEEPSPDELKRIRQRQKNNEAVKICREKRKKQEKETFEAVIKLRALNEKMEAEFHRAEQETELLKIVLPFCKYSTKSKNSSTSSTPDGSITGSSAISISL